MSVEFGESAYPPEVSSVSNSRVDVIQGMSTYLFMSCLVREQSRSKRVSINPSITVWDVDGVLMEFWHLRLPKPVVDYLAIVKKRHSIYIASTKVAAMSRRMPGVLEKLPFYASLRDIVGEDHILREEKNAAGSQVLASMICTDSSAERLKDGGLFVVGDRPDKDGVFASMLSRDLTAKGDHVTPCQTTFVEQDRHAIFNTPLAGILP